MVDRPRSFVITSLAEPDIHTLTRDVIPEGFLFKPLTGDAARHLVEFVGRMILTASGTDSN